MMTEQEEQELQEELAQIRKSHPILRIKRGKRRSPRLSASIHRRAIKRHNRRRRALNRAIINAMMISHMIKRVFSDSLFPTHIYQKEAPPLSELN